MFKLCVLTRWDFNFCIRSSPLRVKERGAVEEKVEEGIERGWQDGGERDGREEG